MKELGKTSAPNGNVELFRGWGKEGLKFFGCITFQVGGLWVWPGRANEGWGGGLCAIGKLGGWTTLLTLRTACRQPFVYWPG